MKPSCNTPPSEGRRPHDDKGRYVPLLCPDPDCSGMLKLEGDVWTCDGLVDPGHPDKELVACHFMHVDGDKYP